MEITNLKIAPVIKNSNFKTCNLSNTKNKLKLKFLIPFQKKGKMEISRFPFRFLSTKSSPLLFLLLHL